MQQSTTHSPLDVATDLPWQEQLLIRLDEIVGLLDSIESRLARCEEGKESIGCQGVECHSTQDTGHLTLLTLTPAQGEEPPLRLAQAMS